MKLIYSHLKKFLPDLSVTPEQLRDDLTMIGHFTNYFEEIDGEIVLDLDIKVNRGDCLGYYGLARDLSVLYNTPLVLEDNPVIASEARQSLPVAVTTDKVKRIMAIKISDLKNFTSPPWLQKFVKLHDTNSVNFLVDLTNYIMFLYGIPVHAFDTSKSTDHLIWEINSKYFEFTSLDKRKLNLDKNILMINNLSKALSLSFWGGEVCAIDSSTTEAIVEIALYDPTTVRENSRQLKSVTESSLRLEKDLDPELIPTAFNHLTKLILENCDGQITSSLFDYYPNKISPPQIEFNPQKVSALAGIDIPSDFSLDVLKRLGCVIASEARQSVLITPPSIRPDITLEADLIEEIIRFWGYQKIPTSQPLTFKMLPDITPKIIYLIDELKDKLVALGYDEIMSWPLTSHCEEPCDEAIRTQNSINSESIYLRQSLIQSLKIQLDQYQRFKLPSPQFFEIGKIYSQKNGQYLEQNSLGIYHWNPEALRRDVINHVSTDTTKIYFVDNFAEIILDDLPKPENYLPHTTKSEAIELTSQIITLDANLNLDSPRDPLDLIKEYSAKIEPNLLWSMQIIDVYKNRYTFRVSYYNCDDKTAKKIHLSTFNLL